MAQNWITYPLDSEDGLSLVGIDVSLGSLAPDASRPACTLVRIAFKKPSDDGLGDSKERDAIGDIEDSLAERLVKQIGAIHVASVRGGGAISMCVYSKARSESAIVSAAREAFAGYAIECSSHPDPKWEMYWDLLPDDDTMREVADMHLVHLLESKGDDLVTPRPVEHFIVFTSAKSADRFRTVAAKHEFECRTGDAPKGGPITIIATREDPVDLESIHEVTSLLANLAETEGGEYDGWETRVVEKK
jgi:uncharacterized protein (DUF2237 family)